MSATTGTGVYYDPYDVDIYRDPYPVFRRLREEAPLYYNEQHDFYALSRFEDCERAFANRETFSSKKGVILEFMRVDFPVPPGTLVSEDPPDHTRHRALVSRIFTAKKMNALEPQIRDFCAGALDPYVGAGGFDFVKDLAVQLPMRVIGMLMGIPEGDQEAIRDRMIAGLRTAPGEQLSASGREGRDENTQLFAAYIDWRAEHPSDDLMTQLLNAEVEDAGGERRRITKEEALTVVMLLSGAGNDTTANLIGWIGKTLADHPEQRYQLAADPSLIPNAIEEVLRFESPGPYVGRYVVKDIELYGQTVPADSAMLLLVSAANRDERRYTEPDTFDIHRDVGHMLTFGYGIHFCIGQALARVEGRVALEEVLKRFPDWEVDEERAQLAPNPVLRGWETLPIRTH